MIKCKDCGREISTSATSCPGCGATPKKATSRATILFGGLFAIAVASCVSSRVANQTNGEEPPKAQTKSTAQLEEEAAREKEFQRVVLALRSIKAGLKNPSSLDVKGAGIVPGGSICVEYRASNSFNAIVLERAAFDPKGAVGDWNRLCAGKSGTDYTHARRALDY